MNAPFEVRNPAVGANDVEARSVAARTRVRSTRSPSSAPVRGHQADHGVLNLVGCGGHAVVVADVARRVGHEQLVLWCDVEPDLARFPPGTTWRELATLDPGTPVVLAFGDLPGRRDARARLSCHAVALIDPSAIIGSRVTIGGGTVSCPAAC